MSESEEEWITVRRRRGGRSGLAKQLKALAIPVVPQPFDALAEPEEQPAQDQIKAKKKKKSKKIKGPDTAHGDDEGQLGQPSSTAARGPATSKATAVASTQQTFFAWLLGRLVALLIMLGLVRTAGASKKKRKQKSQKAATASAGSTASAAPGGKDAAFTPAAVAATPAKQAASKSAVDGKDKAPAAATATKATSAAAATGAPPTPQPKPAAAKAPGAAPAAANTPQKKQEVVIPAPKEAPLAAPTPTTKAPAAKDGVAATAAAASASATPTAAKSEPAAAAAARKPSVPQPAPVETPAVPATPAPPPPPAIKYDADWGRGKFVVQSLPTAHADVVSAVALAGDVAISAGYDGAVKLWHWPSPGGPGGGVAPRLTASRTLVGHSGRVEALAAHEQSRRLASSGRDSTLKVWDLGSEAGGSDAREIGSTYVYESVRTLAVDWAGESGGEAGRVLLGARSGTVLLYSLAAGGSGAGGRKLAALRGHEDEVTALRFLGGGSSLVASGSRDGSVRLWDLRQAGAGQGAVAVLAGLCGRVASLASLGEGGRGDAPQQQQPTYLVAGDCSSTLKLWDMRFLPPRPGPRAAPGPAPRRLPNSPGFAGDVCPSAGLLHGPRSGVLLSSCVAWWTANKQALEEAPPTAKLPMACLNVSAVGTPIASCTSATSAELLCQYQYTVRLGPGVVTCMAGALDETAVLAGSATGALWAMRLVRGGSAAVAAAERAAAVASAATTAAGAEGGCELEDALVVGAEELSDDEYESDEEDDTEDEGEE